MKKFNLLLLLCFGLLFVSCTNEISAGGDSPEPEKPKQEKSYLSLSYKIENEELPENAIKPEKTPESEFSIIELYCDDELHTSWTSDDSESPDSSTASDKLKSSKLSISKGKHTFSLIIKDKDEKILYQSEKLEKNISSGKNEIDFLLSAPKDGKGSLSLTLNWAEDITISKVEAAIFDISENVYNLEDKPGPVALEGFDFTELTVRNRSVVYECENIPAGLYYVKFELYQQVGSELKKLNDSFIEVIYIEKDKLSSGTRTITEIEQFYTIKYNLDTYYFNWKEGFTPVTIRTTNQTIILPTNDDITSRYGYKIPGWYDNSSQKGELLKAIEAGRKGNVELWTIYAGMADINISIENKDLSYTRKYENGYLVYTVTEGFDSYTWAINGNAPDGTSFIQNGNKLSINVKEVRGQTYNIFVSAVSNDLALSRNIELKEIALLVSEVNDYLSDVSFSCDTLPILLLDKNPSFSNLKKYLDYNENIPVSLNFELCTDITAIPGYSFSNCGALKEIHIPDFITKIGDFSFENCKNLSVVDLKNVSEKFSFYPTAFAGCENARFYVSDNSIYLTLNNNEIVCNKDNELLLWPAAKGEIVIPDNIIAIGNSAFYYNNNISKVVMPDTVEIIGNSAFYCCENLSEVILPDTITRLNNSAFSFCKKIRNVVLPKQLKYIGDSAFYYCEGLERIDIPEGVTQLGGACFSSTKLQEINIPDSVISIGNRIFSNCYKLTTVKLSSNLETIPPEAFYFCENLKELIIPDGVTTIAQTAFSYCTGLEKISISKTVNSIIFSAFDRSTKLKFYIDELNETYCTSDNHEAVLSKDKKILYRWIVEGDVTIPDEVQILAPYSLSYCAIKSLDLNNVTTIERDAFKGTYNIKKYIVGKQLQSVYPIEIASSIEVKEIRDVEVFYAGTIEDWCKIDFNPALIASYSGGGWYSLFGPKNGRLWLYINNTLVTELVIPSSIKKISDFCFMNIAGIKKIIINEGCQSIGEKAFYAMEAPLKSIELPASLEKIGAYNFTSVKFSSASGYIYSSFPCELESLLLGEPNGWYYTSDRYYWNNNKNGTAISFGDDENENAELYKLKYSNYFYRVTE